jgi:outer membrane lipoprotein-sorting protein
MRRRVALLIVLLFLAVTALPCFAAPPPNDPPAKPPKTKLTNMIGTWKGTAKVANKEGYASFEMTVKITDQSDNLFRGYVSDPDGEWHFFAGYHKEDNSFVLVSDGQTGTAEMWWEGSFPSIGFSIVNDSVPHILSGVVAKTTE